MILELLGEGYKFAIRKAICTCAISITDYDGKRIKYRYLSRQTFELVIERLNKIKILDFSVKN